MTDSLSNTQLDFHVTDTTSIDDSATFSWSSDPIGEHDKRNSTRLSFPYFDILIIGFPQPSGYDMQSAVCQSLEETDTTTKEYSYCVNQGDTLFTWITKTKLDTAYQMEDVGSYVGGLPMHLSPLLPIDHFIVTYAYFQNMGEMYPQMPHRRKKVGNTGKKFVSNIPTGQMTIP